MKAKQVIALERDFAVIFDMDGVLFDTENIAQQCWKKAAEIVGWPEWRETYLKVVGSTMDVQNREVQNALGEKGAEQFRHTIRSQFNVGFGVQPLPQKPGVPEVLNVLKEHQIPTAVASSTVKDYVIRNISGAQLEDYFKVMIGGDQIENSKPAPDIFLAAAQELGYAPEKCYVVEDSFNGIRSAHAAGTHPLMVPDVLEPTEEIRGLAERVFPSLREAAEYFSQLLHEEKNV